MKKIRKNSSYFYYSFFLFLLMIISLAYWLVLPGLAQENDAIAIQIRPNDDHYSAKRWYEEINEFEGAPQELVVDGYEAVRDGRTVYVNAGNLVSGNFYTNIYLISFSQEPEPGTADVFGRMLSTWTFNTNLINPDQFGHCTISTIYCDTDADCSSGFICSNVSMPALIANRCYPDGEALSCWRDRDCADNVFCDSTKATVTRRTLRYANLADIYSDIVNYAQESGSLPELAAGTFLPGYSLSTWPSWQNALAKQIDAGDLPLDPINTMGPCPGFDPVTCWDEVNRTFGGAFNTNGVATAPVGSSIYGYSTYGVYSFSPDGTIEMAF